MPKYSLEYDFTTQDLDEWMRSVGDPEVAAEMVIDDLNDKGAGTLRVFDDAGNLVQTMKV